MPARTAMRLPTVGPLLVVVGLGVGGCAKSVPLERGVLAYDRATAAMLSKELLLNIARARHNLPVHFTALSNIAATYKVQLLRRRHRPGAHRRERLPGRRPS